MDLLNKITPKGVATALAVTLGLTALAYVLQKNGTLPASWPTWDLFMDAVGIASLAVTLLILSGLQEIEQRYLLRATIPELHERLERRMNKTHELVRSKFGDSRANLIRELSRMEGVLKQIQSRAEDIDDEVHHRSGELSERIQSYKSSGNRDKDEVYGIWGEAHSLSELVEGLAEEQKWKS